MCVLFVAQKKKIVCVVWEWWVTVCVDLSLLITKYLQTLSQVCVSVSSSFLIWCFAFLKLFISVMDFFLLFSPEITRFSYGLYPKSFHKTMKNLSVISQKWFNLFFFSLLVDFDYVLCVFIPFSWYSCFYKANVSVQLV